MTQTIFGRVASALFGERKSQHTVRGVLQEFGFPVRNLSSFPLTPLDALAITAVWSACRVIADGVAQVPWKVFRETPEGREAARDHHLFDLLRCAPSSLQTSFQLRETMVFHAALTGDSVNFLDRVGSDRRVREIIPIAPNRWRLELREGRKIWRVRGDDDTERVIPSELIWHIPGPSWDAVSGLSVLSLAQKALNLAAFTEDSHVNFFGKGAKVAGTYSIDGTLSPEQHEQLTKWIKSAFTKDESFGVMVLDRGASFTPLQMTGVDAQAIETRKHQVEEIARAFRVFPIMIGQADKAATYASAEQMFIAHVVHTLSPWYTRIEQSADKTLLTPEERAAGMFTKFIPNGLMRGASKDRADFYSKALGAGGAPGWMTQNDVRDAEDMNRIEGGDVLFSPANVAPSDDGGEGNDDE